MLKVVVFTSNKRQKNKIENEKRLKHVHLHEKLAL